MEPHLAYLLWNQTSVVLIQIFQVCVLNIQLQAAKHRHISAIWCKWPNQDTEKIVTTPYTEIL